MYQILSCQQFALEEFLSGWSWKNQWRFGCYYLFVLRNDIKQKYLSDARIRSQANHKNDWPQDAPIVADLISLMLLFWLFSSIYWRRLSVGPYHPCQLYINVLYLSKCYKPHRASLTLVPADRNDNSHLVRGPELGGKHESIVSSRHHHQTPPHHHQTRWGYHMVTHNLSSS